MLQVRTLLRYLLISSVVIGLAWCVFVVRIDDRSLFGHVRSMGSDDVGDVWKQITANVEERLEEIREANGARPKPKKKVVAKSAPKPTSPAKSHIVKAPQKPTIAEQRERDRQVTKLREAAELATRKAARPPAKRRTTVDERIPQGAEATVDRLVAKKN